MLWPKTLFILSAIPIAVLSQKQFLEYDYADGLEQAPLQSQVPVRGQPRQDPAKTEEDQRPEPVTILQQINEHNEDGSYTYGYESSDGSFKLETRFPDGRVQGRYGFVDPDTGKLRVIEYGADAMGFQPEGDLPEGIVVPPPVIGNDTSEEDQRFNNQGLSEEQSRLVVQNRARQQGVARPPQPSQNRGQDFEQPPRVETRTRTPQLVIDTQFEDLTSPRPNPEPQQQTFSRFEPTVAPSRPGRFEIFEVERPQAQQTFTQAAPARPSQFSPQAATPAPRPVQSSGTFASFPASGQRPIRPIPEEPIRASPVPDVEVEARPFNPNRARGSIRQQQPFRQPAQAVERVPLKLQVQQEELQSIRIRVPQVQEQPAPVVSPRPVEPNPTLVRFSSFPVQESRPSAPRQPVQAVTEVRELRPQVLPVQRPQEELTVSRPALPQSQTQFQNFGPRDAEHSRPQPPFIRTVAGPGPFQDVRLQGDSPQTRVEPSFQLQASSPQPTFQQPRRLVDFDQLVQEFTAQNRAGRSEQVFQPQPFRFRPVPAVPEF